MKLGANDVNAVKIGSTDVNKVYLGLNLVWQKVSATLLLDLYPNASAAYSLRKLRTDYLGAAIEVRRSSDNTSQDIGFVDNELDTASLLSFVGAGDGFVTTWYDQSLTGVNTVTQDNASEQPKIVNSGSVVTMSGKPAMDTNNRLGSGFYKTDASAVKSANSSSSIFAAYRDNEAAAATGHLFAYGNTDIRLAYLGNGDTAIVRSQVWDINQSSVTAQITAPSITAHIVSSIRGQNFSTIFSDGVQGENKTGLQIPSSNTSGTLSAFTLLSGSFSFEGFYSELLFYPSDQSANRTGIESNINEYHNIYWDGSQDGLLDDYPNAAAAYSLRALNSAYTGAAIRVRRSSDNTEQDIKLLYDGNLDTASLLSFVGAGDGFVTKRYDQSGNGNDLSNISAVNQPKIMSSGQIITENQKPMIDYDGANHYLKTSSGLNFGTSSRSLFLVQKTDVVGFATGRFALSTSVATGSSWGVTPEIYVRASGRVWAGQVSTPTISTSLISNIYTSGNIFAGNSMWLDGSSITRSGGKDGGINTSNDPMMEGARGENTFHFDGKVGDTIIYKSDQSANRVAIETNINDYYTIY